MKSLSTSFSLADFPTHHKISDFSPISQLGMGSLSEFYGRRKKTELVGVSSAV